ncbi:MAG: hypothetical protein LBU82_02610 [Treponema sp.]|jgi:hypothetical protein|nr:hypothetical protein [Treponema sp.]
MEKLHDYLTNLFKIRDDLTLRNIRQELWPLLLVFPLAVIIGDLRYLDLKISIARYQSYELMRFTLGLGWLILTFTPKKLIIPLLRIAAVMIVFLIVVFARGMQKKEESATGNNYLTASGAPFIIALHLAANRGALYSWLLFLALSLLGRGSRNEEVGIKRGKKEIGETRNLFLIPNS